MDKEQIEHRTSVCPKCGKTFMGKPAISREGNGTPICPDCGIREALDSIGIAAVEQEQILDTIHRYTSQE